MRLIHFVKLAFLIILLFVTNSLLSQNNVVDSLSFELEKVQNDTARIHLVNEIAAGMYKNAKDSALLLLQSTIPIAEKINFNSGLFDLWFTKGYIYLSYNQLDNAFIDFETAKEIAVESNDKVRLIKALNAMSYAIQKKRLAIPYLNDALEIATAIGDKEKQYSVLMSLGIVYSNLAVHDTSEIIYRRALALQNELGNKKVQADILRNLGNNAARSNELDKALDYYEQGLRLMREIGSKSEEAAIYNMMGYSCTLIGNFPKALQYYQTALNLMEEEENTAGISNCYENLSSLYISMEDYSQALFYIERASKLWENLGGEIQKSDLLFQKGNIYLMKEDYKTALKYLNRSLTLKENIKQIIEADHYYNLAYCHEQLNQQDSALIFFHHTFQLSSESNDFLNKSRSLKSIGNIYFQQGKTVQAIAELKSACKVSSISGNKEQEMEVSELLYQIYKNQGNTDSALYYLETYQDLQISLFNKKNSKQIGRLEAKFEFEKEKQQLADKQEEELKRQRSIRRLALVALGIALLFIGIIYRYYRSKQKANTALRKLNEELLNQKAVVEEQKEKLEELDKVKSRFFTNFTHEFRTPLTIISGIADQVRSKPDIWLEKGIKMIRENSANLLNLVNQILDLRKLESKSLQLNLVHGDIVPYFKYLIESYQSFAQNNGLELHFLADAASVKMDYDPDKILRIVSNLLSNAIKFTPDGGHIYFQINKKNNPNNNQNQLLIRVKDTGTGIPADQLSHIFDRFYQVDNSITRKGEGTGIGLALTQEFVKLMNGKIEVTSEVHKGSTFTVILPITNDSPVTESFTTDLKVVTPAESEEEDIVLAAAENEEDSALPKLLIVEDNPDVVQFLIACLQENYHLQIANNGEQGIDMAIEQVPDLIVSDVMMPEKDGFELCDTLKQDERTSHIPIILLTAKSDQDSKIEGLERGADAYLSKPFEPKELLVRLKKLLELRQKLQDRYRSHELLSNDPLSNMEDKFIQKIQQAIKTNLSDSEYDILRLTRDLRMSRSQIFRKTKALTGKSPSLYIRSYRLKEGKKLLATTDLTISEIAYEVGFSSVQYFSDAFLEEFGKRPSATRK